MTRGPRATTRVRGLAPLIALLAIGCSRAPGLSKPPRKIAGIPLHHAVTDERGVNAVRQFYGDASRVLRGWTAHYGDTPSLMLYVATTHDPATAEELIESAADRVAAGSTPFRDPTRLDGGAGPVYRMTGQEQIHYVFRLGSDVVWLSADPSLATTALTDLMGTGTPPRIEPTGG